MPEVTVSRSQRLQELENEIRKNYEGFVATGFALKEIRDERLYIEAGFDTWDRYLKERVGQQFGIERSQVLKLIACAQVRMKLPDSATTGVVAEGWSQKELVELGRLAPKNDNGHYEFEKLDKRDVTRVAKKVIDHCAKEGKKPTATIVRKFVDKDLGIDRSAKAKETKKQREEDGKPDLRQYLVDLTGSIEAKTENLQTISEEVWKLFSEDNPGTVKRLIAACESLIALLRRVV